MAIQIQGFGNIYTYDQENGWTSEYPAPEILDILNRRARAGFGGHPSWVAEQDAARRAVQLLSPWARIIGDDEGSADATSHWKRWKTPESGIIEDGEGPADATPDGPDEPDAPGTGAGTPLSP